MLLNSRSLVVLAASAAAFCCSFAAPAIHFMTAEGVDAVVPRAITPDGNFVVGRHELTNPAGGRGTGVAFRWTQSGGLESMGTVLGGTGSNANAVSANGLVVAGEGNTSTFTFRVGFRRTETGQMVPVFNIASTNPAPTAEVTGISADGRVLTGFHRDDNNSVRSFVWTLNGDGPGGTFVDLGTMLTGTRRSSGQHFNRVNALSADGRYLVGWSDSSETGNGQVAAFRYDRQTGTALALGFLPGATSARSEAHAISADGTAVAGFSRSASFPTGNEIFHWTESTGMVGLGRVFSSGQTIQMGMSGNGRYVVSSTDGRAFRWDTQTGDILFLDTVFPELAGWHATMATAASYDGNVITGFGYRNNTGSGTEEGWLVLLGDTTPPPAPTPGIAPTLVIDSVNPQGIVALNLHWQNLDFANPWLLQTSADLQEWTPIVSLQSQGIAAAPIIALLQDNVSVQLLDFQTEDGTAVIHLPIPGSGLFFRLSLQY